MTAPLSIVDEMVADFRDQCEAKPEATEIQVFRFAGDTVPMFTIPIGRDEDPA